MTEPNQALHSLPNAAPQAPREGTPAQQNAVPVHLGVAPDPADPSNLGGVQPLPNPASLEELEETELDEDLEEDFSLGNYGDDFVMRDRPYTVRPLNNGDTFKVGNLLGKVVGDPRIQQAVQSGEPTLMIAAALGALFDKVHRDLQLFCANLVGIKRDYKQARRVELQESQAEGRMPVNEATLRRYMDDEIIEEFEQLPIGSAQDIIAAVIDREDFDDFLKSSMLLGKVAGRAFSKLQMNT